MSPNVILLIITAVAAILATLVYCGFMLAIIIETATQPPAGKK